MTTVLGITGLWIAIFADTGWEPRGVYEHLAWLRSPNVLPFPVHIVSAGDLRADLLAGARGERWASIPAFTRTVTPAGAELPVYDEDEMAEGDLDLFRQIVDEAVNWQAKVDQMTDRALVAKWPIARIDPVLRALFRAAGAELVATPTPPKVVITEFVDIARAFFPEGKEPKFVNAVLDHMAREARPEAF